jgi:hypothetical protein
MSQLPANYCETVKPAAFNYTEAIPGGAWLEWDFELAPSYREWFPDYWIVEHHGAEWMRRQRARQGWMTGCWIRCVK